MKKLILSLIATCMLMFSGCKSTPSEQTLYSTSYAIGVSTALVMNQTKISDDDRNVIIDIITKINTSVPEINQTFTDAWTPIATEHVDKLVVDGKLDSTQGQIILTAFKAASESLDYVIFKRYPKIGTNVTYVTSITHGFCTGLLTYFKPTNSVATISADIVYDAEVYEIMQKKITK